MSFDDLLKELQGQKSVQEDPDNISLEKLFNESFMRKHSSHSSFGDFVVKVTSKWKRTKISITFRMNCLTVMFQEKPIFRIGNRCWSKQKPITRSPLSKSMIMSPLSRGYDQGPQGPFSIPFAICAGI